MSSDANTLTNNLFRYVFNTSGRPVYLNNEIKLIVSGTEYLNTLVKMIRRAKDFIHMQYFIIADGVALDIIFEELKIKNSEGVKIKIIYD
jgi:cardiolipin synthase